MRLLCRFLLSWFNSVDSLIAVLREKTVVCEKEIVWIQLVTINSIYSRLSLLQTLI